ncbi:MAG: hypothetical protein NO516_00580 [Candidatus Methanomethylicia archaeon]|nr:hypothetical protein [Candidatus Methanomethylicia archaeon]
MSDRTLNRIGTGCRELDSLLSGGLEVGEILLVYGERGSGKTALAFQVMSNFASLGKGAAMVYTEGRPPVSRLMAISGRSWDAISDLIWVVEVKSFESQESVIEELEYQMPPGVAVIAIDTITSRYREVLGEHDENIVVNKSLNRQLAMLKDLCRRKALSVLITGEVRMQLDGKGIQPVAPAILSYWSDRIVRLERPLGDVRKAVLERPPPKREAVIRLTEKGFIGAGGVAP